MFSKVIKAVIVEKISYLVEKYNLLLLNYYKALKQKSIIDAFLTILEKICKV